MTQEGQLFSTIMVVVKQSVTDRQNLLIWMMMTAPC